MTSLLLQIPRSGTLTASPLLGTPSPPRYPRLYRGVPRPRPRLLPDRYTHAPLTKRGPAALTSGTSSLSPARCSGPLAPTGECSRQLRPNLACEALHRLQ
jgi:hypothetical protein